MTDKELLALLDRRLGRVHARQRLGIEQEHQAQLFGQGLKLFNLENLPLAPAVIAGSLRLCGLYGRGRRNAAAVMIKHNIIAAPGLPKLFDGFTILHLSDLHIDTSDWVIDKIVSLAGGCAYDACVLTGDYRGLTAGPYAATLAGMARLRQSLKAPVYGVLGNHDTIAMLPGLDAMGIRMLMNECEIIERGPDRIHLAGIDDGHYFRADNIEKAASGIPHDGFAILLSHTPEIYRRAAYAGFQIMLSGHTHGGQICLPGGIPVTLDSVLPRHMGSGPWAYRDMAGYTSSGAGCSIVPLRFNCPPEITLHQLRPSLSA